jgi:hypothetical protein
MMNHPKSTNRLQSALWRHPHFWGAILVVAASALAFGPESWMEWLFWAASVDTVLVARVILVCIAAGLGAAMVWPLISTRRR